MVNITLDGRYSHHLPMMCVRIIFEVTKIGMSLASSEQNEHMLLDILAKGKEKLLSFVVLYLLQDCRRKVLSTMMV